MQMIKVELSRKTHIDLFIYGIYAMVIGYIIKLMWNSEVSIEVLVFTALAILFTLMLISVLPLKRNKKVGELQVEKDLLVVEHNERKEAFKISQVENLKITLQGFDGQLLHKHMKYLRPQDLDKKTVVDGLGNYIKFNYDKNNYKFNLYFNKEKDYEEFKGIVASWKEKSPSMKLNILR